MPERQGVPKRIPSGPDPIGSGKQLIRGIRRTNTLEECSRRVRDASESVDDVGSEYNRVLADLEELGRDFADDFNDFRLVVFQPYRPAFELVNEGADTVDSSAEEWGEDGLANVGDGFPYARDLGLDRLTGLLSKSRKVGFEGALHLRPGDFALLQCVNNLVVALAQIPSEPTNNVDVALFPSLQHGTGALSIALHEPEHGVRHGFNGELAHALSRDVSGIFEDAVEVGSDPNSSGRKHTGLTQQFVERNRQFCSQRAGVVDDLVLINTAKSVKLEAESYVRQRVEPLDALVER